MTIGPVRLRPDNFTPPSRTPWGGRKILDRYKHGAPLDRERAAYAVVGESWEVSVEPDFPSRVEDSDRELGDVLAGDPAGWLGAETVHRHGPSTPLLVKLLDAADDLSVQVHPANDYAGLSAGQSGKPETWWIVDRDPGAGLYLGLREGVTRRECARALEGGGDVASMLNFVPVEPGDFFVIGPGVVHAIGRGVTLVEPQFVLPSRRGVTYRFWDWNRRYDASGNLDPAGKPRELHVEHALAVTAWDGPRGRAFVESVRPRPVILASSGAAKHEQYQSAASGTLAVERVSGTGSLSLPTQDRLWAVTVVAGEVAIGSLAVGRGRSAVVPAALGRMSLELRDADAILTTGV